MTDLGKRIKEARLKIGLKQKDLASILELTPQSVSGWERGVTYPQVELYEVIARTLKVSKDWLFFYKEENKHNGQDKSREKNSLWIDTFNAPLYSDISASAGHGAFNECTSREFYPLPSCVVANQFNKSDIICINCHGDSMEPIIKNRSILAVNTSMKTIQDGGVYVLSVHNLLRVKALFLDSKGVIIRSYNPEYKDECISFNEYHEDSNFEIIGKVFWYSSILN
jgi:phage repressor protein C with HTH and peptisase S24 domain